MHDDNIPLNLNNRHNKTMEFPFYRICSTKTTIPYLSLLHVSSLAFYSCGKWPKLDHDHSENLLAPSNISLYSEIILGANMYYGQQD